LLVQVFGFGQVGLLGLLELLFDLLQSLLQLLALVFHFIELAVKIYVSLLDDSFHAVIFF
jgi:hypothetical protein